MLGVGRLGHGRRSRALVRGLPWMSDFVRRMLPPDLSVLPAALLGARQTIEIALLGTAVAAVLGAAARLPLRAQRGAAGALLSRRARC